MSQLFLEQRVALLEQQLQTLSRACREMYEFLTTHKAAIQAVAEYGPPGRPAQAPPVSNETPRPPGPQANFTVQADAVDMAAVQAELQRRASATHNPELGPAPTVHAPSSLMMDGGPLPLGVSLQRAPDDEQGPEGSDIVSSPSVAEIKAATQAQMQQVWRQQAQAAEQERMRQKLQRATQQGQAAMYNQPPGGP